MSCLLLASTPFIGGCGEKARPVAAAPKSATEFFPMKLGDKTVRLQLAVLPAEQARGLMERRDIGDDEGMVFIFAQPRRVSFWMKNTPTALDLAYFNPEAELAEVWPAYPLDERPVPSRSDRIKFVVEMKQGWFRTNRVQPGAKLDVKALTGALKARGFEPRNFGLGE